MRSTRFTPKRLLLGLTVLLVVPVALWAYKAGAEWQWFRSHPAPGQLIDVGGYPLHLVCMGTGAPTVVLEAGVGDVALMWQDIQRELSQSVRTCSYDRGGFGQRDPSPLPRDPSQEATELHRLLERAGFPAPYILVGHSYGGDVVRVYAGRFPAQLAGVVFVEASNENRRSEGDSARSIRQVPLTVISAGKPEIVTQKVLRLLARTRWVEPCCTDSVQD